MGSTTNIFLLLCCLLALTQSGLRINHNFMLVDDQNRELMIHGGCVVVKLPPYFPVTDHFDPSHSFSDRDFEIYKELGMNGVRLGAMWAGVEPKKDWYNITYLEQMVQFINKLGQNGIYTLVDFHQDIISEKFCGDGVPIWLIDQINAYRTFPFPWSLQKMPVNQTTGMPDWKDCKKGSPGKYYLTDDVGRVLNQLYNTKTYLHQKYVKYWQTVASYLKGNPYVIAYELMNQPFPGNAVRNPALLIPQAGQRLKFQKFYDSVVRGIREVDNDTNICFEPITFDFAFPSGFTHAPGGNMYRNKSILCYHYQQPPVHSLKTMYAHIKDHKRLGVALLMSQFGGNNQTVRQFVEQNMQSYFYWQYKTFGNYWYSPTPAEGQLQGGQGLIKPDGTLNDAQVPNVARTGLQRVAGSLKQVKYRVVDGYYKGVYEATPGGTSVLYMSKNRIYKEGYRLEVTPRDQVKLKEEGNYIEVTFTGSMPALVMIVIQKI